MSESKLVDTHATDIVQGEIQILGIIHGAAINTLVSFYANPADWTFKQFVSQVELDEFASENKLVIRQQQE